MLTYYQGSLAIAKHILQMTYTPLASGLPWHSLDTRHNTRNLQRLYDTGSNGPDETGWITYTLSGLFKAML